MASKIGHAFVGAAQEVDPSAKLHSLTPERLTDGGGTQVVLKVSSEHTDATLARLRSRWPLVSIGVGLCNLTGDATVTAFVPSLEEMQRLCYERDLPSRRWLARLLILVGLGALAVFLGCIISQLSRRAS
jgi:hypothetical protein